MALMNLATYGYTMIAARSLGPREYGALAAMMNLLLVVSVLSLGLQATAARRVSAHPGDVAQIEREVRALVWRTAALLGAALVLLSPLVNTLLQLDDLRLAALAGVAAVPLTLVGGFSGVLQGERRWLPLGLVYLANGVPRIVLGGLAVTVSPTALGAFVGVTLGVFVPAAVGRWALRGRRADAGENPLHGRRAILRETAHNSQALLAFFALSNVDVIVARNALPDHEAGLYAGGLILTKMLMFLPQFVVVVAFPSMSSAAERTRPLTISLLGTATVGLLCTGGVAVLSPLALALVGGQEFAAVEPHLWAFALAGTTLALVQLLVYSVLARRSQRSSYLVWAALVALVAGGSLTDSVTALLLWVLVVDTALLLALVAISYLLVRRHEPTAVQEPEQSAATAGAL